MTTRLCPQCGVSFGDDVRFCPTDGSSLRSSSGELIGEIVAERYLVERMLGEGGMGRVYLAEHVKMGRKSALKVMSAAMMNDADAIGRFNREASNASRISHPNVAAIYDFGETSDGLIYLAMEFVEGEPLSALLEREGALPSTRVATLVRQIADALEAAHELGIVHRDLKPDNIMIARGKDGGDLVKVVDFGIAKAPDAKTQAVTRTGLVVGTPEFMSPEQIAGDQLDGRSDIYALGLVTFTMLTGTLPFANRTMQEAMLARLTDEPRTLEEARPTGAWPEALQRAMDRVLARSRDQRFGRAGEFAEAIKAGLGEAGATVSHPRDSGLEARTKLIAGIPATRESREAVTRGRSRRTSTLLFAAVGIVIVTGVTVMGLGRAQSGDKRARGAPRIPPSGAVLASATDSAVLRPVTRAPAEPSKGVEPLAKEVRRENKDSGTESLFPSPGGGRAPPPPSRVPSFSSRQAQRALNQGQALIDKGETRRALLLLQNALPRLTMRSDSVRAIYHVGEALLKQGERRRGCTLLQSISADPSGGYARSAASLYDSQCQ